ncbi:MAG: AAA family ATPase [Pseudomonadota bacterium]
MIQTLGIANYRSIHDLRVRLGSLNVVTGPNGSGKSNFYRALRLLANCAQGRVTQALAREGGLKSTLWAGPEVQTRAQKAGTERAQGTVRQTPLRLKLGFAGDTFGYAVSLGIPVPAATVFNLDPEIKRESIFAGAHYRAASALVDRQGPVLKVRDGRSWRVIEKHLPGYDSLFARLVDPDQSPEAWQLRDEIRCWRFYDHFRSDSDAPARQAQLGTRTPVLDADGRDLAAALQTILELGDPGEMHDAVEDAFPGSQVSVAVDESNRFEVRLQQPGLLRPLHASELSDGTLRYLLWIAALLTPRPPPLMVLNEPETSLHPDLLPALGRLIIRASSRSQIWVISHAQRLVNVLERDEACSSIHLEKVSGATTVLGQGPLERPNWHWAD